MAYLTLKLLINLISQLLTNLTPQLLTYLNLHSMTYLMTHLTYELLPAELSTFLFPSHQQQTKPIPPKVAPKPSLDTVSACITQIVDQQLSPPTDDRRRLPLPNHAHVHAHAQGYNYAHDDDDEDDNSPDYDNLSSDDEPILYADDKSTPRR